MKIGNIEIEKTAALAPMAGVADKTFRELCKGFGAAYTVSEMVSAKGVSMGDKKSEELMDVSEKEHPAAVQIFGTDPEIMAQAAVSALNMKPDIIDINMGCPAPKIIKGGAGSALMKTPELAGKIIKAVSQSVDIPVTVKIRTGWDSDHINAVEMAEIAEKNGAAAVTVHGRTKEQMYAPPVNFDIIKEVKKAISIPVIGNGDIDDIFSAAKMYEDTGCDLVMVGRGALGCPWLFQQISAYMKTGNILPEPPVSQKMLIMLQHIELLCNERGEHIGMREARKHALWYTKGLRGAAEYRRQLSHIETVDDLKRIAFNIVKDNEK
ncbi:MAG: tRNA dihydrouridine synthase DusB [Clostridia bacterium]|nr:tRNA dihydrouridine synthase DusB [Clostridia bacterium]